MGTCILHDNRSNVSQVEVDYPTHYLTRGYRLPRKGFTVNSFFTMRQLGPNVREMEKHQVAMYLFALILSYSAVGFIGALFVSGNNVQCKVLQEIGTHFDHGFTTAVMRIWVYVSDGRSYWLSRSPQSA